MLKLKLQYFGYLMQRTDSSPSALDEALAPYSVSREVPRSVLKCETVLAPLTQAWKPSSQHAGEKRGVAGLLLGRTERAARALESLQGLRDLT